MNVLTASPEDDGLRPDKIRDNIPLADPHIACVNAAMHCET